MLELSVSDDFAKLTQWAKHIAEDQIPFATAVALTRTAKDAEKAEQRQMPSELDRPTRFSLNALFTKPATKRELKAHVWLKDTGDASVREYLRKQIEGGDRGAKRFERALQRVGLLPQGWVAVPGEAAPLDAYGNVPGRFIVQLLSYLNAFSEQGHKANMTDKRRSKLAQRVRSERGFVRINGVVYFVSLGVGPTKHLARGIWAKTGTHGADIKPVFLFVSRAKYERRLTFYETVHATVRVRFVANWRQAWREAMATRRR